MQNLNSKLVISVIVPIYQQWDLIGTLFDAMRKQSLPDGMWELIVVNNSSEEIPVIDNAPENIILLNCPKPGSYAARNVGAKKASGSLFVFTDADCAPEANWLEEMYLEYIRSQDTSLLAGNIVIDQISSGVANIYELFDMATGLPQRHYVNKGYAVTANLAIPKLIYDRVGGFDEERFSGGDAVFCQRAAGDHLFELVFLPNAIVHHPARNKWEDIATKIRRVKGGQVRSGSALRRTKYLAITLLPPVWKLFRILRSERISITDRFKVCLFQSGLWLFELYETMLLLLGKKLERR